MKFASAISSERQGEQAARDIALSIAEALDGAPPDLCLVFMSHQHRPATASLLSRLHDGLHPAHLIGCTADGVIGTDRELEREPALSVWAASLPGVTIQGFHLSYQQTRDGGVIAGWPEPMPAAADEPIFLLLPEPHSMPGDELLERLNDEYPGCPVLGGMASGAMAAGQNLLFLDREVHGDGAVGITMTGNVTVTTVVSQGCRPVGKHFVVTKAQGNIIQTLGGRPALAQLQDVYASLPEHEKQLLSESLHLGRVINEYRSTFGRGDFLVRNLMGFDQQSGAIAAADHFRAGQTVQFHVRDTDTAREDLRELLRKAAETTHDVAGALLFSCNGRGQRLFGEPDQDVGALRETIGPVPVAGFFAQGEIGPVGGRNFLHGFTASVGLFVPKPPIAPAG
ncbi:MAG: FIST N-terminal domain-containing protein [Planctomycetota bacterium]